MNNDISILDMREKIERIFDVKSLDSVPYAFELLHANENANYMEAISVCKFKLEINSYDFSVNVYLLDKHLIFMVYINNYASNATFPHLLICQPTDHDITRLKKSIIFNKIADFLIDSNRFKQIGAGGGLKNRLYNTFYNALLYHIDNIGDKTQSAYEIRNDEEIQNLTSFEISARSKFLKTEFNTTGGLIFFKPNNWRFIKCFSIAPIIFQVNFDLTPELVNSIFENRVDHFVFKHFKRKDNIILLDKNRIMIQTDLSW